MKIKSEYKPYDRQKETFGLNMAVCGMFNESFKIEFVEEAVKVMQYTINTMKYPTFCPAAK